MNIVLSSDFFVVELPKSACLETLPFGEQNICRPHCC